MAIADIEKSEGTQGRNISGQLGKEATALSARRGTKEIDVAQWPPYIATRPKRERLWRKTSKRTNLNKEGRTPARKNRSVVERGRRSEMEAKTLI